eukprot:CAMPEP_0206441438 /NCGR_PEP_ID=MMETSP0324_2-20121206/13280_1 /ASSEMBLY_ACC=CAM_ASM_000836 /TAXON_ID=2866 /ORGANISM="Crypthecodinium cohnii, Strain Seligo" /LENGTH=116 /DNA_ID=CAMNT_0053909197 /DNA_START=238 /DNA_END=585 /DNA_ORIENTATION=+
MRKDAVPRRTLGEVLFLTLNLQLGLRRESLDRHSNSEIGEDLLAATVDGRDLVDAVEGLDDPSHACASHTTTSENLDGVVSNQVARPGHGVLQECDSASQERTLGALLAHAVGDLV